ncbi:hypothetical protein JCM3775_002788 [Rhodotorula graminis]
MSDSFNPLFAILDVASRFLPTAVSDPLYTLASADLASLRDHPSQLLPLVLSLLAAWTAFSSFVSWVRFGLRTSVFVAKWGALGALGTAAYMAYQGVGTDKGAVGGAQDAAKWATMAGRGIYSLGRKGAGYYFGDSFGAGSGASSAARSRAQKRSSLSSSSRRKTAAPANDAGSWDSGRDTQAEDFVQNAMGSVLEFLNPGAGGAQETLKRTAKRAAAGLVQGDEGGKKGSSGGGGGLSGFAWDLAMGKAQKAWDEVVGGAEPAQGKTKKKGPRVW